MRPEEKIEKAVCEYAKSKNILTLKMSIPGQRGWPDRQILMGSGYTFFIEFKAPGGKLGLHQIEKITALKYRGFSVYIVDDIKEGKMLIDREIAKLNSVVDTVWGDQLLKNQD